MIATRYVQWLFDDDTGVSSETIWCVMTGVEGRRSSYPFDPSDFGRCYRLLQRFPEWRIRLGEVAAKYPEGAWPAMVNAWDAMVTLYEEEFPSGEAPRLYALMRGFRDVGESDPTRKGGG